MGIESASFDLKFRASCRDDVRDAVVRFGGVVESPSAGMFEEFIVRDEKSVLEAAVSKPKEQSAGFAAIRMTFCSGDEAEDRLLNLLRGLCEAMGDGYLRENQTRKVFRAEDVDWKLVMAGVRDKKVAFEAIYGRIETPMTSQEFWSQRRGQSLE